MLRRAGCLTSRIAACFIHTQFLYPSQPPAGWLSTNQREGLRYRSSASVLSVECLLHELAGPSIGPCSCRRQELREDVNEKNIYSTKNTTRRQSKETPLKIGKNYKNAKRKSHA